jgi:hypothetical protein
MWAQDRRRSRQHGLLPAPSSLLGGLHSFYRATPGRAFSQSWNGNESFDGDPMAGFEPVYPVAGTGYTSNPFFFLMPYRESGGTRVYAGVMKIAGDPWIELGEGGWDFVWPGWSGMSGWTTGCLIVRGLNNDWSSLYSRVVSAATMASGWLDDGTGWTSGVPHDFDHPPTVARVLWKIDFEGRGVAGPCDVVMSPLGGSAFDVSDGGQMVRMMVDDLRRSLDGTMAYWYCPTNEWVCSMWIGGAYKLNGVMHCSMSVLPEVSFAGFTAQTGFSDSVAGDWYLIVQRSDTLVDTSTLDVFRLRDGAHIKADNMLVMTDGGGCSTVPLLDTDDFFADGMGSFASFGGGYCWWQAGAGYCDRIGLWNRPLTDAEVEDLFNCGLGWTPA